MYKIAQALVALLLCSPLLAAPDGAALYERHCSGCHSFDGRGGIGLPLIADKIEHVSDDYLFKTIRLGRPGRVMPSFQEFGDAQVKAIIRHLRQQTGTVSHEFDPTPVQGDAERGRQLYAKHCMRCHAEDGTGEGEGTGVTMSRERAFFVMPAAISNPGFQDSAPDEMIKLNILEGRVYSGMPSFRDSELSEQDINDIVVHVRSLRGRAVPEADPESLERPSHAIESPYDFETTVRNIKQALAGSNFRIFPERYLEQGLIDEFSHNRRQLGIRFCNFNTLYGMLKIEPRLGVVLPCRITVLEAQDGSVTMVVPNLKVISRWFNNDELVDLWDRMEDTFAGLIEEVTL